MPTVKELKKHLESFGDDTVIAYDIWQVEDVKSRQEVMDANLTEKECEDVLEEMYHRFDANYGMCWDVMDVYILSLPLVKKGEEV